MERRAFFKLAGFSAASLAALGALGACGANDIANNPLAGVVADDSAAPEASAVGQPAVSFSSEVDVLVVGSGVAGLSAAMAPLKAGRSVMIAEKLDLLGGESYGANGVMRVAGSAIQRDAGIKTTVDEAWAPLEKELAAAGASDLSAAKKVFAATPDWADRLAGEYGAQFADPKTYSQAEGSILLPKNGLGDMGSIMTPLRDGLSDKGAVFSTGHRACAFIVTESNTVCGMRFVAESAGSVVDVRARRIVIATGGFASSQPLVHKYVPSQERVGCYTFASMGEGQALCASVGGQLVNMDKAASLTSDLPQVAAWGLFAPTLIVDVLGHRFAREDVPGAAAGACFADERGFWWTIFNEKMSEGMPSRSLAEVTSKNAARLVGPFNDVAGLAGGMGVPVDTLGQTFERFKGYLEAGKDGDFGRTAFLDPFDPPWYAIKQFPVRYKTRGGVQVDEAGQVLGAGGAPVQNICCCGAAAASCMEGLASSGAAGMLVGEAVTASLDGEDA